MFNSIPDEIISTIVFLIESPDPSLTISMLRCVDKVTRQKLSSLESHFHQQILIKVYDIDVCIPSPSKLFYLMHVNDHTDFLQSYNIFPYLDVLMNSSLRQDVMRFAFGRGFDVQKQLQNVLCRDYLRLVNDTLTNGKIRMVFYSDSLFKNNLASNKACLDVFVSIFSTPINHTLGNTQYSELLKKTDIDTLEYLLIQTDTVTDSLNNFFNRSGRLPLGKVTELILRLLPKAKLSKLRSLATVLLTKIPYDFAMIGRKMVEEGITTRICNVNSLIKAEELYEMISMGCFEQCTTKDFYMANLSYDVLIRLLEHPLIQLPTDILNEALEYSYMAHTHYHINVKALVHAGYAKNLDTNNVNRSLVLDNDELITTYLKSPNYTKDEKDILSQLLK